MFCYFGFGSNMNMASMKAKGVEPFSSKRAELRGWRLRFNVQHFFRHEGGVGNIEYTGNASDRVLGILHECPEEALPHLDAAEAYGYGYDRIDVSVKLLDEQSDSRFVASTYVGMTSFINEQCLPSQRYLIIMVKGARDAGLDVSYVSELAAHPVHEPDTYPAFAPPSGDFPTFNATNLVDNPLYTALSGFVFDMSQARETHEFLKGFFGGEDMTLFHLKRMDTSTQNESLDMIKQGQLSEAQLRYLNVYLNEYAREYRYVGRYDYEFN